MRRGYSLSTTTPDARATSCAIYAHADCYRNAESDAHAQRYSESDTAPSSHTGTPPVTGGEAEL